MADGRVLRWLQSHNSWDGCPCHTIGEKYSAQSSVATVVQWIEQFLMFDPFD